LPSMQGALGPPGWLASVSQTRRRCAMRRAMLAGSNHLSVDRVGFRGANVKGLETKREWVPL